MPIYEVALQMTYKGQQCINRWNYSMSGTPAAVTGSFALAFAFGAVYDTVAVPPGYPAGTILDALTYTMTDDGVFEQLTALNVYSVTDFYQTPFVPPYAGKATGEGMSPFTSVGYRTNVVRRDISRGTKRTTAVPEAFVGDGGTIDISGGSRAADVASRMTDVLTYDDEGNTLTFTPCVVSKQRYEVEVDGEPTGRFAYRYYPTEAEQLEHIAAGVTWSPYANVRSQVSRQYGRGR